MRGRARRVATIAGGLVLATAIPLPAPADRAGVAGVAGAAAIEVGRWGPLTDWPIIPIHVVMTPDGRLLSFGTDQKGRQTGYLVYDVYDPATGEHHTLPNRTMTDIFCATQTIVPSTGEILISGGDQFVHDATPDQRPTMNHGNSATTVFDPGTDTLTSIEPMAYARWYGTQVVLPDGRILMAGGLDHDGMGIITVPEIWDPATRRWTALPGAAIPLGDWYYPKLFVMPDGRVLGLGNTTMFVIDVDASSRDSGAWWRFARGSITSYGNIRGPGGRMNYGNSSTAVMFEPGRILQVGGGSNEASIIDVRGARPVVTATSPMISGNRNWANSTVLPDGSVLVTGGSEHADETRNGQAGVVHRRAERWTPATGAWQLLPAEDNPRLYHSTALLLADATVMSGGGGAYQLPPGDDPARINHLDVQIFSPAYLAGGRRPTITAAPTVLQPGETFDIEVTAAAGPIERVVLVKLPSVTHGFNNEQRSVPLTFTADGDTIRAEAPASTALATPGYYYLFVLDAAGTPSVAHIVGFALDAERD